MDVLQSIMDSSSHAIFTMDRHGIVTHINHQAKERFGLFNHSQYSHPAGRLEPGDVVILADTAIGGDDGNLQPQDLEVLDIHDPKIKPGDMLVAIAAYRDNSVTPIYKFLRPSDTEQLHLQAAVRGVPMRADITGKQALATVNTMVYSINYFQCIGQIVVLDGHTMDVKFWQELGYSARKEGIGNLLRGASFIAKSPDCEIDVVGYHFRDFFEGPLFEEHLRQVLSGQVGQFIDQEYEINGFDLMASILPVEENGQISGVIVKFRNIEDIKVTIMERNNAIKNAERRYRESERGRTGPDQDFFPAILGSSSEMAAVRRRAYKLSQIDCNILITGESGTGKSFLAQVIHQSQPRGGPFVKVDCSTIAPTLFESEMFGYVGGAFTGASPKGRAGFFEEANGGTIFLDEIGEIPLNIQAKLLSCIQNKEICRVGSTKLLPVDVRILAATNCNLRQEVAAGRFRQDLYYRLSAFSLELPPLRDCREDLYLLIDSLMDKIRKKYGMPDKFLSGEAFSKLVAYDWPGNIRELENVLESAVVLSDSDIIYAEHIRIESEPVNLTLRERLKQEERRIIQQVLAQCGGNRAQAMQQLGLSKTVFYSKLKEHHLH